VPVCSTAGTYKFLKGVANGAPTWSDIPTSSAINSNTNDTLATSAAVNALNNNKATSNHAISSRSATNTNVANSTWTIIHSFTCTKAGVIVMEVLETFG